MLFIGAQNSNEEASIKIASLKTGAVIFGYSVHKTNSARGKLIVFLMRFSGDKFWLKRSDQRGQQKQTAEHVHG